MWKNRDLKRKPAANFGLELFSCQINSSQFLPSFFSSSCRRPRKPDPEAFYPAIGPGFSFEKTSLLFLFFRLKGL
ncbi:MAG: hypothetical protein DRG82_17470 [Deltaproteobacteria bacterium]|nr:MAG: hypothetical protein DRG82_17470 [Deltaproteobacteria bacterium]